MAKKKERQSEKLEDEIEAVENQVSTKKAKKRKSTREPTEDKDERKKSSKKGDKKRKKHEESPLQPANEDIGEAEPNVAVNGAVRKPTAKTFPLASGISIPTRADLKSLSSEAQSSCFAALGTTCERILRLIDDTESAATRWRENKKDGRDAEESSLALEDALVADMARLKGVPVARQFAEMSLWKRLKKFNEKQLTYIESLRSGAEKKSDEAEATRSTQAESISSRKRTEEFVSFKAAHMKHLTNAYAQDLEKIREAESLDVAGVETLLRCLDEGAELFATAMTYKKP